MTADPGVRLWRDGDDAIPRLRRGADAAGDAFETTLLNHRAVVVRGRAGAELFYDTDLVERHGAVPPPIAALLFGRGAVHGLDGETHRQRKQLFLELLTPERTRPLAAAIGTDVAARAAEWDAERDAEVVVFDELVETYGPAVLGWAGLDISMQEARVVSRRLAAIVDGFGGAPFAYPKAWAARVWADRWARRLLSRARSGAEEVPADSVVGRLAAASERDLPARVAAVELINVLRPTVAVAWHGTFAALELARHPEARRRILEADSAAYTRAFVHEVRRLSPFVPALAARAVGGAELDGVRIRPGDLLILDVDATNPDRHAWDQAQEFAPERFLGVEPDEFGFVPHGGGDPAAGHRCPGEPLAVDILVATVGALAPVEYDVVSAPRYDLGRMPTRPAGGLVVRRRR